MQTRFNHSEGITTTSRSLTKLKEEGLYIEKETHDNCYLLADEHCLALSSFLCFSVKRIISYFPILLAVLMNTFL